LNKIKRWVGDSLDGYYTSAPGDSIQYPLKFAPTASDIDALIKETKDKKLISKLNKVKAMCTKEAYRIKGHNRFIMEVSKMVVKAEKKNVVKNFDAHIIETLNLPAFKDKKISPALSKPSMMRQNFVKIQELQTNLAKSMKNDEKAEHIQEKNHIYVEKNGKKNEHDILVGLGVANLFILVAGVGFCAYKKTLCFKKTDEVDEGGAKEDKALFKKEFKKSHKKHVKEHLVPDFSVDA